MCVDAAATTMIDLTVVVRKSSWWRPGRCRGGVLPWHGSCGRRDRRGRGAGCVIGCTLADAGIGKVGVEVGVELGLPAICRLHANRPRGLQQILDRRERVAQHVLLAAARRRSREFARAPRRRARRRRRRSLAKKSFALALQPVGLHPPARADARVPRAGSMRSSRVRSGVRPPVANAVDRDAPPPPPARARRPGRPARSPRTGPAGPACPARAAARATLLHELGARGRVQQRLGARRHRQGGVLDERANPLGHVHSAGLAQQLHAAPLRGELARERSGERRLAGAVDAPRS